MARHTCTHDVFDGKTPDQYAAFLDEAFSSSVTGDKCNPWLLDQIADCEECLRLLNMERLTVVRHAALAREYLAQENERKRQLREKLAQTTATPQHTCNPPLYHVKYPKVSEEGIRASWETRNNPIILQKQNRPELSAQVICAIAHCDACCAIIGLTPEEARKAYQSWRKTYRK